MMEPTLWDDMAPVRRSDPDTSHEAARSFDTDKLRERQRMVLDAFRAYGPMTDTELQDTLEVMGHGHLFVGPSTARTRREELGAGPCKACHGTGFVKDEDCQRCDGTGRKPGLIVPLLDAAGEPVKRLTAARRPSIVWCLR